MTDSGRKGRVAEREVARLCQEWWSRLERGCEFVRTPLSGGWSTPTVRVHFRACGDLMTTAERWPFVVEVKRRENWSMKKVLEARPTTVWDWWSKASKDAADQGAVPMLWIRKNSRGSKTFPWLVFLPAEFVEDRRLPSADATWGEKQFAINGLTAIRPVVFVAERLLKQSPRKVALEVEK